MIFQGILFVEIYRSNRLLAFFFCKILLLSKFHLSDFTYFSVLLFMLANLVLIGLLSTSCSNKIFEIPYIIISAKRSLRVSDILKIVYQGLFFGDY